MPRRRQVLVAVVVAAALSGPSAPVAASIDDRSTDPTITTSTTTTTTAPPGIDVGHLGDQSGATPPGHATAVEPADPDRVNEVLQISSAEAQARLEAVQAEFDALAATIERLEADLRAYERLTGDLAFRQRKVARRAIAARHRLTRRAVGAYVDGNAPEIEAAYGAGDPNEVEQRSTIVRTILEADRDQLDGRLARRLEVTALLSRVLEQAEQAETELVVREAERDEVQVRLDAATYALQVFEAGGDIVITGFVFPVADPHTFSSTFGAPRSGGRSHEGNDIFAPMGTPLVACERGVIDNMGVGELGGTKLWVVGESGTEYYYAHLSAYADGITDGTTVEVGQIIGYVGNTGNAISTPPHLHFEIHPGGGSAIDPYPLLHAVDQLDGEHVLPARG